MLAMCACISAVMSVHTPVARYLVVAQSVLL